jgi:hypothetical protein
MSNECLYYITHYVLRIIHHRASSLQRGIHR